MSLEIPVPIKEEAGSAMPSPTPSNKPHRRPRHSRPEFKFRGNGVKKSTRKWRSKKNVPSSKSWTDCNGHERPPWLKSGCSDVERCLFDLRFQYRHKKGTDMWQVVEVEFKRKTGLEMSRACLQMRYRRGRKYIQWQDLDVSQSSCLLSSPIMETN